jgi:mono/diheme cytochrome c family protein
MSVFAASAPQISAIATLPQRSQLRAGNISNPLRFVSRKALAAKWRDASIMRQRGERMHRSRHSVTAILVGVFLCGAFAPRSEAAEPSTEAIARGKALVEAGDCASCHTADAAKPFAGGKRIGTPFGGIYAPNLTPDRETGIGGWSEADFYQALRHGVAPNGSRYYPAFPYPNFTVLVREDILAIRAYLATLPPVRNSVPPPELTFPLNFRVVMRLWNYLFFKPGIIIPDQAKGTDWNRGRYLVEGLAHCGACHTPKNALGADKRDQAFGGNRVDGMFAPRLDGAARSGLKSWSAEDIAEYLQSGRNARSHAGPLMSEVVVNSTSKMSDADIRAIAVYLKSLPSGAPEPAVAAPAPSQMTDGEKVYRGACIACHEADGSGAPRIYPPLPANANLQSADPLSAIRIILDGAETVTTPRAPNKGSMPAYATKLSDQQIADVTTYIRNAWGNAAPAVSAAEVAKARR